jgi:hypothetical protein
VIRGRGRGCRQRSEGTAGKARGAERDRRCEEDRES